MLAALAITAALFGTPVTQDTAGPGEPLRAPALLDPTTLKPGPAELTSLNAALSPDGRRVASVDLDGGLQVFDVRTGRRTANVGFEAVPGNTQVTWLAPDRVLVFQGETIRVVDPEPGVLIRTLTNPGAGIYGVSQVGDRVLVSSSTGTFVVDASGRTRFETDAVGLLSGPLVYGDETVYRIDVHTGKVKQRDLPGWSIWVADDPGGVRYLEASDRYIGIDPKTLKTTRIVEQIAPMLALKRGYIACCQDLKTIKRYTDAGKLVWKRKADGIPFTRGNRVYVQRFEQCVDGTYRVEVLDLKTGRTLRTVKGRFQFANVPVRGLSCEPET